MYEIKSKKENTYCIDKYEMYKTSFDFLGLLNPN